MSAAYGRSPSQGASNIYYPANRARGASRQADDAPLPMTAGAAMVCAAMSAQTTFCARTATAKKGRRTAAGATLHRTEVAEKLLPPHRLEKTPSLRCRRPRRRPRRLVRYVLRYAARIHAPSVCFQKKRLETLQLFNWPNGFSRPSLPKSSGDGVAIWAEKERRRGGSSHEQWWAPGTAWQCRASSSFTNFREKRRCRRGP